MFRALLQRQISVRTALGLMVLVLLGVAIAFQLGLLDSLVRKRYQYIAQNDQEYLNRWFGVDCIQYPTDLQLYQELLHELKPDVIIETGTNFGGLTLYLAMLQEMTNPEGKILTVDIDPKQFQKTQRELKVSARDKLLGRIHFIEGSSTAPEVIQKMKEQIPAGARVLVILDSLHTKDHVAEELKLYSPFVTKGSYLIVNDTHLGNWLEYPSFASPQLKQAVNEFVAVNDSFVIDHAQNRFAVSCAPAGFLKRVK